MGERLVLYHNVIRSIPDSVIYLQSLQFLDLSRNSLSYLPPTICELPLQALIVNNNRLVSLPEEIGKMSTLMKLDASCNEITHLPVQIGDLTSLKVLNLRRNHLQEIPIEISYLQLTTLDLSGNRIASLPVELRFMTTVVNLNLGENPLTCPPANLVSRGKIHVFKYLEIQAIKEDRKRGVLTDGDYRRSYRKTTAQLNDFRFASGFGADARRKRHTADSGYGSEQPLDRRWSQDFSQDDNKFVDMPANETDSGRLLSIKSTDDQLVKDHIQHSSAEAINNNQNTNRENSDVIDELEKDERRIVASKLLERQGIPGPNNTTAKFTQNHKFPSTTNTSILPIPQASNHSSRHAQPLLPPSQSNNSHPTHGTAKHNSNPKSGQTTPTNISPSSLLPIPVSSLNTAPSSHQKTHVYSHRQIKEPPKRSKNNSVSVPTLRSPSGSIPIKIEHQSSASSNQQNRKPSTVLEDSFKHYDQPSDIGQSNFVTHAMQITAKNAISNNKGIHSSSSSSSSTYSVASSSTNPSTVRIQTSPSSTSTSSSSLTGGSIESGSMAAPNSSIKKTSSYDVKAFQKEAVLSYVKAKQHSPAHSVASLQPHEISDNKIGIAGHRSASPRMSSTSTSRSAQQLANNATSLITSHKNALAQHNISNQTNSSIPQPFHTNGLKQPVGKSSQNSSLASYKVPDNGVTSQRQIVHRRDAEKSTTADSHIAQLKMHIESRLRISLPEN